MPVVEVDPVLNGDVSGVEQDIEIPVRYDLEDKCKDEAYAAEFVKEMEGKDFNFRHVQKEGFDFPILVKSKSGLHMKVPRSDFTVKDVRACVGSSRQLTVKYPDEDGTRLMTAKEFHKYCHREDTEASKKPNIVASVEFSHTRLENFVKPPLIVRQLDWDERVWPRHLKLMQTESADEISKMMYPKVQKVAVMSGEGCFTDFKINPGGSSSWQYISTGKAVIFLIRPSYENYTKFMDWNASSKKNTFFGDLVDKCGKIVLERGQTFFLPAGWIHAIFTPEDTLIFGGNFLHSFSVKEQLEVAIIEESNKVPETSRFPFFSEMLWYVLERYVHVLTGKSYICGNDEPSCHTEDNELEEDDAEKKPRRHVTKRELMGLKAIIVYLHRLPPAKKMYPDVINDPAVLISDVYHAVTEHEKDDQELAITGKPLLLWPDEYGSLEDIERQKQVRVEYKKKAISRKSGKEGKKAQPKHSQRGSFQSHLKLNPNLKRHRRVRCRVCVGCTCEDCGDCDSCFDMLKFGGPGTKKQSCVNRKCIHPVLPYICVCSVCKKRNCKEFPKDPNGGLFECVACGNVAHESCMAKKFPGVTPEEVDDVKKEWHCHKCVSGTGGNEVEVVQVVESFVEPVPPVAVSRVGKKPGRPKGWKKAYGGVPPGDSADASAPSPSSQAGTRLTSGEVDGTDSDNPTRQIANLVNSLRSFRKKV